MFVSYNSFIDFWGLGVGKNTGFAIIAVVIIVIIAAVACIACFSYKEKQVKMRRMQRMAVGARVCIVYRDW